MRTLTAWLLFIHNCTHYLLHRMRLRGPLDLRPYTPWWDPWLTSVFRWKHTLRIRGTENCPQDHPILITGNHIKLEDPFCYWAAVHRATHARLSPHFLMRDDFFHGKPWDWLPLDINEIARAGGAFPVSRGKISLTQLRPILNTLCQPASIIMFPGRTRTRTGLLIEYPEGLEEPGSPAFLMTQVQRRNPALTAALLPVCRTWNPVTRASVMNIGPPRYISTHADRTTQRALDQQNLLDIAHLIEVHTPHIIALILYLLAHHAPGSKIAQVEIERIIKAIIEVPPHEYLDPSLGLDTLAEQCDNALAYFQSVGMLTRPGGEIGINAEAIRTVPEPTPAFRKKNPVLFLVNQVLHLRALCEKIENEVLSIAKIPHP